MKKRARNLGWVLLGLWSWAAPGVAAEFPEIPSIYTRYAADASKNLTLAPLQIKFTSAEVEVGGEKLKLPDLGFLAMTYPKGLGFATPVYFSSDGKLPAPLEVSTPYYVVPVTGGGYRVYPLAKDADAPLQPGGVLGEKVLPAQNAVQGVGGIVFGDGGSGTHTLFTKPLISQLTDLTANGLNSSARNPANRNSTLELDQDGKGRTFMRTAGALDRENWVGSYSAYGPSYIQGPSEKRYDARKMVEAKRVVYQIFVCRVRSFQERQVMKFMAEPKDIDIGTDRIIYATDHRMVNRVNPGDLVQVKTYGSGKLPPPLQEEVDYYANKTDPKSLTLHRTAEDAIKNVNPIDLTDRGEGNFLFWFPERVGDSRRWSFFTEALAPDSGGNTLSVRLQEPIAQGGGILKNGTSFNVSGNENGNVSGLNTVPELSPVVLWAPPRAKLPAPLQAGMQYWVSKSKSPGSVSRLHSTLASAKESMGKDTASSSCIKFSGTGTGESLASYDDHAAPVAYGSLMRGLDPFATRIPFDELCILVFKIDFDAPDKTSIYATLGVNEAFTEGRLLDYKKGPTPMAVKEPYPAWTMFNSAQGHVPIDLDLYEVVFGSSTGEVADAELQKMVDYFKAKYEITKKASGSAP